MPRIARVEVAGGIHHVTSRGNRKAAVFHHDADRRWFLRGLAIAAEEYRWNVLAHCLMTNHIHLVIETPEETLGLGMRQLNGRYAQRFNRLHETGGGHVFQARFGSVPVDSDVYFAQLLRYVALNPVVAGLCRDPAAWRWSSHRRLLAGDDRVEERLAVWGGEQGGRYRRLFEPGHELERRYGAENPWNHRPPLAELLGETDAAEGLVRAADHGYRMVEIGAAVGLHPTTVSRRIRRARAGSVPEAARGPGRGRRSP